MNPFVGMVAVPGIVLFLTCPLIPPRPEGDTPAVPSRQPLWVSIGATILGGALILTAIDGVTRTVSGVSPWIPEARGIAAAAEAMLGSLPQSAGGPTTTTASVSYSGGMSHESIGDVLVFAKGYVPVQPDCSALAGRTICTVKLAPVAQAEWDAIEGGTETEKLCAIARRASADVDILIVPSRAMNPGGLRINLLQDDLKALLHQVGRWQAITRDIRLNDAEAVDVLLNVGRRHASGAGTGGAMEAPRDCPAPAVTSGASGE